MARPRTLILLALLVLALGGCGVNARKYPPQYEQPQSRTDAAKMLHTALMQGVEAMMDISVNESALSWEEVLQPLSKVDPAPRVTVAHTLMFSQLSAVSRPERVDDCWRIALVAGGGNLTLIFNDADAAGRAEAALRRLQPGQ